MVVGVELWFGMVSDGYTAGSSFCCLAKRARQFVNHNLLTTITVCWKLTMR